MSDGGARSDGSAPEFLWDPSRLRLVWANEAGLRFWGEEALIDLVERAFGPGDEMVRILAARMAETEQGDATGMLTLFPQGDPVWVAAECAVEEREDARRLLRVRLGDIALREETALFRARAGFEAASQPIAIFSAAGEALARNEADRRIFADPSATLFDRYVEPAAARRALRAALSDGAHSHTAMVRCLGGATLRHRMAYRRLRDPVGGDPSATVEFTDISDRPRPEGVSPEALARVAHDIRAPLNAIKGFAELLRTRGEAMPSDRRDGALVSIETACGRLGEMVDRILVIGETGPARIAPFDLAALAEEVAALFRNQAESAGRRLTAPASTGDAPALGDEEAARRCVVNLADNALRHGAGDVSITVGFRGARPLIEIADQGDGPPEVVLNGTVRRADPHADMRPGGLGLGNVRELAARAGAEVEFETRPGSGFAARLVFALGRA